MTNAFLYLAALASALLIAALCEFRARLALARSRYYAWTPYLRIESHLVPDVFPDLEERVNFSINSEGERGDEPQKDGMYRILLAGGSAAECYYLDQQSCLPVQMQRRLQQCDAAPALHAKHIHAGSIARSGVDVARMHSMLSHIVPQHGRVDAAVFMVGAGDVVSWLRDSAPAGRRFAPFRESDIFEKHPAASYACWPLKASALAEAVRRGRQQLLGTITHRTGVGESVRRLRQMRARATCIRDTVPAHRELNESFSSFLRASIDLCRAAGAQVIVVGQPWLQAETLTPEQKLRLWNAGVGDVHREQVSTYYSPEAFALLMREFNAIAAHVAAESGAHYIEVLPLLQPPAECFYDDLHFTPKGAGIVAQAVSDALLQLHLGSCGPSR